MDKEFNIQCERCKISEFKVIKTKDGLNVNSIEDTEKYAHTISYCDNIEECEKRFNEEAKILMGNLWESGQILLIAWRYYQGEGIDNFWRIFTKDSCGFETQIKIERKIKNA